MDEEGEGEGEKKNVFELTEPSEREELLFRSFPRA